MKVRMEAYLSAFRIELGASPGASTAVTIMLEVLERCFASRLATKAWQEQLKALFPSWGGDVLSSRSRNTAVLGL